jgi:uncharacterized protein (TIGR03382 family)
VSGFGGAFVDFAAVDRPPPPGCATAPPRGIGAWAALALAAVARRRYRA